MKKVPGSMIPSILFQDVGFMDECMLKTNNYQECIYLLNYLYKELSLRDPDDEQLYKIFCYYITSCDMLKKHKEILITIIALIINQFKPLSNKMASAPLDDVQETIDVLSESTSFDDVMRRFNDGIHQKSIEDINVLMPRLLFYFSSEALEGEIKGLIYHSQYNSSKMLELKKIIENIKIPISLLKILYNIDKGNSNYRNIADEILNQLKKLIEDENLAKMIVINLLSYKKLLYDVSSTDYQWKINDESSTSLSGDQKKQELFKLFKIMAEEKLDFSSLNTINLNDYPHTIRILMLKKVCNVPDFTLAGSLLKKITQEKDIDIKEVLIEIIYGLFAKFFNERSSNANFYNNINKTLNFLFSTSGTSLADIGTILRSIDDSLRLVIFKLLLSHDSDDFFNNVELVNLFLDYLSNNESFSDLVFQEESTLKLIIANAIKKIPDSNKMLIFLLNKSKINVLVRKMLYAKLDSVLNDNDPSEIKSLLDIYKEIKDMEMIVDVLNLVYAKSNVEIFQLSLEIFATSFPHLLDNFCEESSVFYMMWCDVMYDVMEKEDKHDSIHKLKVLLGKITNIDALITQFNIHFKGANVMSTHKVAFDLFFNRCIEIVPNAGEIILKKISEMKLCSNEKKELQLFEKAVKQAIKNHESTTTKAPQFDFVEKPTLKKELVKRIHEVFPNELDLGEMLKLMQEKRFAEITSKLQQIDPTRKIDFFKKLLQYNDYSFFNNLNLVHSFLFFLIQTENFDVVLKDGGILQTIISKIIIKIPNDDIITIFQLLSEINLFFVRFKLQDILFNYLKSNDHEKIQLFFNLIVKIYKEPKNINYQTIIKEAFYFACNNQPNITDQTIDLLLKLIITQGCQNRSIIINLFETACQSLCLQATELLFKKLSKPDGTINFCTVFNGINAVFNAKIVSENRIKILELLLNKIIDEDLLFRKFNIMFAEKKFISDHNEEFGLFLRRYKEISKVTIPQKLLQLEKFSGEHRFAAFKEALLEEELNGNNNSSSSRMKP